MVAPFRSRRGGWWFVCSFQNHSLSKKNEHALFRGDNTIRHMNICANYLRVLAVVLVNFALVVSTDVASSTVVPGLKKKRESRQVAAK